MRQISPESKYCKVVHADDWLFPECVSRMVEVAEVSPSVGIVSAYRLDETRVNLDGLPYPSTFVRGREICRSVLLKDLQLGSPTALLIRSDLIRKRKRFYDESTISADTQVCFELLQESDFGFVHQVLTYTRRHNESISSLMHRFSTNKLAKLICLTKYGPIFLSDEEYEQRLERRLEGYYSFLSRSVFELRDKEFWSFHKNKLEDLGYPICWGKLIKACFLELLNLRITAGRIKKAMKRRKNCQDSERWETVLSSVYTEDRD